MARKRKETDRPLIETLNLLIEFPEEKAAVAYHEAGHAVMAWILKRPVLHLTIVPSVDAYDPDNGFMGYITVSRRSDRYKRAMDLAARAAAEHEIMIAMAGPLAEESCRGERVKITHKDKETIEGDSKNHHGGWTWGSTCEDDDENRRLITVCHKRYLDWLKARTLAHLNSQWPMVDALASQLIEKGTMSGYAFRKFMKAELARIRTEQRGGGPLAWQDTMARA